MSLVEQALDYYERLVVQLWTDRNMMIMRILLLGDKEMLAYSFHLLQLGFIAFFLIAD